LQVAHNNVSAKRTYILCFNGSCALKAPRLSYNQQVTVGSPQKLCSRSLTG